MKKFLSLLIVFSYGISSAQILQLGKSIVTAEGASPTDAVVRIIETRYPQNAPLGYDWPTPRYNHADWIKGSNSSVSGCQNCTGLGNIFGIAYDDQLPSNIYVSASNIYMSTSYGSMGAAGIYKLDGTNGAVLPLTKTSQNFIRHDTVLTRYIYNTGCGLGNLCYPTNAAPLCATAGKNFLFVTNFEDGKIYRVNTSTGVVTGTYDPFGDDNKSAGACPLGERIWGIGYYNHRLYFARWSEDAQRTTPNLRNGIYSVSLDSTDLNFTGTMNADGSYSNSDEQLEIEGGTALIPNYPNNLSAYPGTTANYPNLNNITAPVSDIEFSTDGKLLIAERSMASDKVVSNYDFHSAHFSRVFEFEKANGVWQATNNFFIGNIYANTNSAGGVDYGYGKLTCDSSSKLIFADNSFSVYLQQQLDVLSNCEQLVWSTGDGLRYPQYNPVGNVSQYENCIYGIAGIPVTGNSNQDTAANWSKKTSIYVDYDSTWNVPKARMGDVDVYRMPCSIDNCLASGIGSGADESGFRIFPNPAKHRLIVESNQNEDFSSKIELISVSGGVAKSILSTNKREVISLNELASGVYFLRVTNNGVVKTSKVVVAH